MPVDLFRPLDRLGGTELEGLQVKLKESNHVRRIVDIDADTGGVGNRRP